METMKWILQHKVIAIVRSLPPDATQALADALLAGGVRLIEVTFAQASPDTWKDTVDAIRSIGKRHAGNVLAGAGTVLTLEQLHMAADAGAKYIISPDVNEEIHPRNQASRACFPPRRADADRDHDRLQPGCRRRKGVPGRQLGRGLHQGNPRAAFSCAAAGGRRGGCA